MGSLVDYESMECPVCGGSLVPNGDFDVECVDCGYEGSLLGDEEDDEEEDDEEEDDE